MPSLLRRIAAQDIEEAGVRIRGTKDINLLQIQVINLGPHIVIFHTYQTQFPFIIKIYIM